MNATALLNLLKEVRSGRLEPQEALERLRHLPYEDIGFAKLDHHRQLRCGFPEVVFCEGKTTEEVVEIIRRLAAHGATVLATRTSAEAAKAVRNQWPEAVCYETARCIVLRGSEPPETLPGTVVILTAGTSDRPVAEEARPQGPWAG